MSGLQDVLSTWLLDLLDPCSLDLYSLSSERSDASVSAALHPTPPPPTPTCATATPTTAIECRRWRKRLPCPYIRSRNLKSKLLCKNKRMNFGATTERRPSTPGLYREKSPTTSAFSCSRSRPRLSTARPFMSVQRFTNVFSESCDSSTTTESRCTAIWIVCWNTTSQPLMTKLRPGAAVDFRLFPGILKRLCHGNSQCGIPNL